MGSPYENRQTKSSILKWNMQLKWPSVGHERNLPVWDMHSYISWKLTGSRRLSPISTLFPAPEPLPQVPSWGWVLPLLTDPRGVRHLPMAWTEAGRNHMSLSADNMTLLSKTFNNKQKRGNKVRKSLHMHPCLQSEEPRSYLRTKPPRVLDWRSGSCEYKQQIYASLGVIFLSSYLNLGKALHFPETVSTAMKWE